MLPGSCHLGFSAIVVKLSANEQLHSEQGAYPCLNLKICVGDIIATKLKYLTSHNKLVLSSRTRDVSMKEPSVL